MDQETLAFNVAFYACFAAFIVSILWVLSRRRLLGAGVRALLVLALAAVTWFIAARWHEAGYPPFSNRFEGLICFAWCLLAIYFLMELIVGMRQISPAVALMALGLLGFAWLEDRTIRPLLPALQNNFWLTTHVLTCFLGYAAFLLAMILALGHLGGAADKEEGKAGGGGKIVTHQVVALILAVVALWSLAIFAWRKIPSSDLIGWRLLKLSPVVLIVLGFVMVQEQRRIFAFFERLRESFERGAYLAVAFGFLFLGVGIITGSIWASVAWGRYWGWDPKETASLVTWLIFAAYLHLRVVAGKRPAWLSWIIILGFFGVLFTYFGVNYLQSLHAYSG